MELDWCHIVMLLLLLQCRNRNIVMVWCVDLRLCIQWIGIHSSWVFHVTIWADQCICWPFISIYLHCCQNPHHYPPLAVVGYWWLLRSHFWNQGHILLIDISDGIGNQWFWQLDHWNWLIQSIYWIWLTVMTCISGFPPRIPNVIWVPPTFTILGIP